MNYIDQVNVGGTAYTAGLPNMYINSKGNFNIETSAEIGNTSKGKINIESMNDIQFKPGDDIIFYSHHRAEGKQDEVAIKVTDGEDVPVKLQLNAAEIALTTKDKPINDNPDVLDVTINSNTDTRGYLKVRAQAIDLRCEKHGGIALQPKGYDGDGNMNKIKFEHGGGDGLEFGTFNTEKSSLFTDEYRFNKAGVWKMATRQTTPSGKTIRDEGAVPVGKPNTADLKYVKQADDFYDIIDTVNDPQTTTEAIIKTSAAFNNRNVETTLSSKKNLKIATANEYQIVTSTAANNASALTFTIQSNQEKESYTKEELKVFLSGSTKLSDYVGTDTAFNLTEKEGQFQIKEFLTPKVSLESEEEVDLSAKNGDVVLTAGDCIKCEAPEVRLNALKSDKTGGMVNFGATQDVVFVTKKLTAGMKVEAPTTPTKIKQALQNNSSDTVYWNSERGVFKIPLKEIYTDAAHTTKLTKSNYSDGIPLYFANGSLVPADYTCYTGIYSEDNGTYITDVYVVATKGSSAVAKKNLFQKKVATYTNDSNSSIGTNRTIYENAGGEQANYEQIKGIDFMEFVFPDFNGSSLQTVGPEQYVITNQMDLVDLFELVDFFKNGAGQANGPWAQQL